MVVLKRIAKFSDGEVDYIFYRNNGCIETLTPQYHSLLRIILPKQWLY